MKKNKILSDFFEMYEFDKKSNEIPIPFGYFSSKKEMDEFQKRDLLSKELILCVGNIYSNYHEKIIKIQLFFYKYISNFNATLMGYLE